MISFSSIISVTGDASETPRVTGVEYLPTGGTTGDGKLTLTFSHAMQNGDPVLFKKDGSAWAELTYTAATYATGGTTFVFDDIVEGFTSGDLLMFGKYSVATPNMIAAPFLTLAKVRDHESGYWVFGLLPIE